MRISNVKNESESFDIIIINFMTTYLAILNSSHVASKQILKTKCYTGAVIPCHGRGNGKLIKVECSVRVHSASV